MSDDLVEGRMAIHQLRREIEHLHDPRITDGDGPVGVHHHDALVHMLQRGSKRRRLLGQLLTTSPQFVGLHPQPGILLH